MERTITMSLFKCKMCGGDLEIAEGVTIAECEYCGTKQTVPKALDENLQKKLVIADICDELKCSKSTLLTTFKKKYGTTVNSYLTHIRLERAVKLLVEGNLTISEIASETGFSDQSYFSKVFSAKYGIPPSEYKSLT